MYVEYEYRIYMIAGRGYVIYAYVYDRVRTGTSINLQSVAIVHNGVPY